MILVVSGATGGHLYPAIALLEELNQEALMVVSRKHPVESILAPYDIPFKVLPISFKNPWKILLLFIQSFQIIRTNKPSVILLMGGSICVPLAIMGWVFRVPLISFEQNTIPGRATRAVQWFVAAIITAFESTQSRLNCKAKVHCLGNPIRIKGHDNGRSLPKELYQLLGQTLLVVGGSQGAKAINDHIVAHKAEIMALGWNIIHLTGPRFFETQADSQIIESVNNQTYIAIPYADSMTILYEKATHVLCRSGATTLAELRVYRRPSILIPYPFAKDNHQLQNAIEFCHNEENAKMIPESELSLATLKETLLEPIQNYNRQQDNANDIVFSICEFVKSYLK
jgi:UDP-N-acetylglucosamine--N-acetylmuramyl-(pentapeptide) pyrophosphoryl-undecaprenol N-acetylglucosamine transferase